MLIWVVPVCSPHIRVGFHFLVPIHGAHNLLHVHYHLTMAILKSGKEADYNKDH